MVVRSIIESCGVDSEIYQTCSFRVIFKMTLAMNINNLRHVLRNFLASFGIVMTFSMVIKHENTSNNLCWWFLRNILNAPHFEVFTRTFLQSRQSSFFASLAIDIDIIDLGASLLFVLTCGFYALSLSDIRKNLYFVVCCHSCLNDACCSQKRSKRIPLFMKQFKFPTRSRCFICW